LEAASESSELSLAAISLWEISALARAGRISTTIPSDALINTLVDTPGMSILPLDPHVAVEAERLPEGFTGDLCDRLIAATARRHGLVLCSADERFHTYGRAGHVRLYWREE
jgi:PIN domain nuclease of toxin-antitoxin system